jgi:hypothetical protein
MVQVAYAIDCANGDIYKTFERHTNDEHPQQLIALVKQWVLDPTEQNKHMVRNASTHPYNTYFANTNANNSAYANYFANASAAATYAAQAATYAAQADYAAAYAASASAYATYYTAADGWPKVERLYVMAKGPAYAFDERWLTSDVVALVKGIVADDAFDRMLILADALQDAGFDDVEVLKQLQTEQCGLSHWIIWNVMGWGK